MRFSLCLGLRSTFSSADSGFGFCVCVCARTFSGLSVWGLFMFCALGFGMPGFSLIFGFLL